MRISLERYLFILGVLMWSIGVGLAFGLEPAATPQIAALGIGAFVALGIWLCSYRDVLSCPSWKRAQLYSLDAEPMALLPSIASVFLAAVAVYSACWGLEFLVNGVLVLLSEVDFWTKVVAVLKATGVMLLAMYAAIGMVLTSINISFRFRLLLPGIGLLLVGLMGGWDTLALGAIVLGGIIAGTGFLGCIFNRKSADRKAVSPAVSKPE